MLTARDAVRDYLLGQFAGSTSHLPGSVGIDFSNLSGRYAVTEEAKWLPHHDVESGFPLVQNVRPEMLFATGIVHAPGVEKPEIESSDTFEADEIDSQAEKAFEVGGEHVVEGNLSDETFGESLSLDLTQQRRPEALGVTGTFVLGDALRIRVTLTGSVYVPIVVAMPDGRDQTWHRRVESTQSSEVDGNEFMNSLGSLAKMQVTGPLAEHLELKIRISDARSQDLSGRKLFGITVVAVHLDSSRQDIFHSGLEVELLGGSEFATSVDNANGAIDLESSETAFLYRHVPDFASGHGASAAWNDDDPTKIWTDYTPIHENLLLSTQISGIQLGMQELSQVSLQEVRRILGNLTDVYEQWITEEVKAAGTYQHFDGASSSLQEKCRTILRRMRSGIEALEDPQVFRAFQLMNQAMFLQQVNGKRAPRVSAQEKIEFASANDEISDSVGNWYPFQIGFILMALPGVADETDASREIVDLIYFPTGGGKTEAYLGLTSFQIFLRRLRDPNHSGVDVLMRYTLRLLTAQQFERGAGLIVAMEKIRRETPGELGSSEISAGVWLGQSTTPNTRKALVALVNATPKGRGGEVANPFLLSKCPWCSASFGYHEKTRQWAGIRAMKSGSKTIARFVCPDRNCEFSDTDRPLPIWLTDEDVYDFKPSFLVATVDKFARMSRVPEVRAIFGIDSSGSRNGGLPPGLIIQDELHLISGPLGSMVGLYEGVIESLSSRTVDGQLIFPKLVASTATTRNYKAQVKGLYNRDQVQVFPQALSIANETFFSTVEKDEDGNPQAGTQYLGLFPGTLLGGQLATSTVAATLAQAPMAWSGTPEEIDYYKTSLWFFNSLKELGQTLTLFQTTVLAIGKSMNLERRLPFGKSRSVEPIMELTGRIESAQVSDALLKLSKSEGQSGHVRTCLSSSIMEVGVDVARLGLLTVASQPKLTAQYIQVTGRVGRARALGPGLVVMLYNTGRTRDRSIFESFKTFHRRLYANVEPLSVTPFAEQTMEKGLIGALISHYRMVVPDSKTSEDFDQVAWSAVVQSMRARLEAVAGAPNLSRFDQIVANFTKLWPVYAPPKWEYSWDQETGGQEDTSIALLRSGTTPLRNIPGDHSTYAPQSMRTVDGQSQVLKMANPYHTTIGDENG